MTPELEEKIHYWADAFDLPRDVVVAQVMVESSGDTWACRFEIHWRWFVSPKTWSKVVSVSKRTEVICQQMSWGLLQVMGAVYRELGGKEDITKMCDPDIGLEYGCKKLAKEIKRWGSLERGLAAYNAGSPKSKAGQRYTRKVLSRTGRKSYVS